MKANEQYFPVVLYISLYKVVLSLAHVARVRGMFRPFEAFFAFWRRENCGKRNTAGKKPTFLRSPQFLRVQKAKNASNLQKALRKRLLRRLFFLWSLWVTIQIPYFLD